MVGGDQYCNILLVKMEIETTTLEVWQYLSQFVTSLVAQMVKHLPAMQETGVWFLGQEDPLEKEMAIHSSTLA